MELTLDLLLYYIRDLKPAIIKRPAGAGCFAGVKHLPDGKLPERCFPGCEGETFLYVAESENLLAAKSQLTEDMTVLFCADKKNIKKELRELPCGLIAVKTKVPLSHLVNTLIGVFHTLTDWDKNMHIAALTGRPLQEIVDISEPVLQHPMIVFDAGFDVLAYTKNLSTDYANFKETTVHGYTNSHTMDLIKRNNILFRLKKGELLVAPAVGDESITTIYLSFYGDQNIIGYGCIFLEQEGVDKGYLDLVRIIYTNLTFCLKREFDNQRFGRMFYETFLLNLLNNIPISQVQIQEQLKNIEGLSENGHFILGVVRFSDPEHVPVKFLARQMDISLWDVKPVIFENQICLLRVLDPSHKMEHFSEKEEEVFGRILSNYDCRIGISNEFNRITDIRYAYHQAGTALRFGGRQEKRIVRYEDYYFYDLLDHLKEKMPVEFLKMGLYSQLKEYDEAHKTAYCDLVLTYIKCGCNASYTAKQLFLHRNTIRNAVAFVEESWNVTLKDLRIRKMMLVGEQVDMYLADVHSAQ